MPNRFAPITPDMQMAMLVSVLNRNFAELDNEVSSKVFYGADGNPAVIFGRLPNGKFGLLVYEGTTARVLIGESPDGTYGIWVSKDGEDVLTAFS